MGRVSGVVLTLLASASIALGSPLCCIVGTGCCGTQRTAKASEPRGACCEHCKRDERGTPAPKPCEKKDCTCKHDVATHATAAADHAPLVAVTDVPAAALPAPATADTAAPFHRAVPPSPARATHPLLL
jgi:hypothetical protein